MYKEFAAWSDSTYCLQTIGELRLLYTVLSDITTAEKYKILIHGFLIFLKHSFHSIVPLTSTLTL